MKSYSFRLVFFWFVFLAISVASSIPYADIQMTYTASGAELMNPERGIYGYGPMEDFSDYDALRASGVTLCYASITLDDYRTSNIAQTRIDEISNAFSRMRAAGIKGIVRINYNEDGSDDTTLAWMETHLQQLQPILEANKDVIAFFQAGMIGAWGEWHSSTSGLDNLAGREAVWNLLLTYLPACTFIQVRTPAYVYELEGDNLPLDASSAFTCSGEARIAHHNDCWLASDTDYGTYPSDPVQRETWKSLIANDTTYVPWGGETCNPNVTYANCVNAVSEAERFHATFLNRDYHPDVIDALQSGGCWDEFKNKLGYRFELLSAALPEAITKGQNFSFSLELENVGWAPLYNERPVYLRLFAGSAIIENFLLNNVDPRWWQPEAGIISVTGTLTAPVTINESTVGLALWLPDIHPGIQSRPEYAIQFANIGVWDNSLGHNVLVEDLPVISAQAPTVTPTPTSTGEPTITPTPTASATPTATSTPDPNCDSTTYATMAIDGDMSDWNDIPLAFSDAANDHGAAVADITAVYLANDQDYLYIRVQTSNLVDIAGTNHLNFFFDTDGLSTTGYNINDLGSEFLKQASGGYDERGGEFNEGGVNGLDYAAAPPGAATDVEMKISRNTTYASDSAFIFDSTGFNLQMTSDSLSWSLEEFAPDTSGGFSYQFACEPPLSVHLWRLW